MASISSEQMSGASSSANSFQPFTGQAFRMDGTTDVADTQVDTQVATQVGTKVGTQVGRQVDTQEPSDSDTVIVVADGIPVTPPHDPTDPALPRLTDAVPGLNPIAGVMMDNMAIIVAEVTSWIASIPTHRYSEALLRDLHDLQTRATCLTQALRPFAYPGKDKMVLELARQRHLDALKQRHLDNLLSEAAEIGAQWDAVKQMVKQFLPVEKGGPQNVSDKRARVAK